MGKWDYIKFDFSGGMSTSVVNPGTKFAKRLLNVHNHQEPGKLKIRPGYELKYEAPSSNMLTNKGFLNFDVFFDRQADISGKEVTCLIQKAILYPLEQNMLCFWIRPYWSGTGWVDEWKWINQTFVTVIDLGLDATYPNMLKLYLDPVVKSSELFMDDSLVGFTIFNKTKNQYAKVITSKVDGDNIRICHTLYENNWAIGDTVYIGRNWIDLTYHEELFENLKWQDIVFHRINNDLRIGFGGYENRPGLSIGYRKKYFALSDIDFTNLHPDLDPEATGSIDATVLQRFSTIDEVVLDTAVLNNDAYGIELTTQAGTMLPGTYYFRLTGYTDNFNEQLIAQASIEVDGTKDIVVQPYIISGIENPRLTRLKLYQSTDNITFYKINEDLIASNEYTRTEIIVSEGGRLLTKSISLQGNADYHADSNAASIDNEVNSIGSWLNIGDEETELSSVTNFDFFTGNVTPDDGSYFLLWNNDTGINHLMKIRSPLITSSKRRLSISFSLFLTASSTIRISSKKAIYDYPNPFDGDYVDIQHNASAFWQQYTIELEVDGYLTFEKLGEYSTYPIGVDKLSVTNIEGETYPQLGAEMKSEMGYTPSFNLVKGWDQCITFRGRAYYLNPFVEKRYENYILVSHIHSSGAYMYDIASFSNFRELEKFDSNKAIGLALLRTMDIIILKDASILILSDDGTAGILREPIFGVDCISLNSIVNMNGIIMWCGGEEIYEFSGGFPKPLLKYTIRDIYRDLSNKDSIFCVRDKDNTYRLRTFDSSLKTEYLYTENGWIEESKWHFPEVYRAGFQNRLFFLSNGNIYQEEGELDYSASTEIIMSDAFITDEE